jgi:hypothetical protein
MLKIYEVLVLHSVYCSQILSFCINWNEHSDGENSYIHESYLYNFEI